MTKINKAVVAGRVAGPCSVPPLPHLQVSPLGVVPKKAPGKFRLIQHLSYPKGGSVNDQILEHYSSVPYSCLDEVVSILHRCGVGALLAKKQSQASACYPYIR